MNRSLTSQLRTIVVLAVAALIAATLLAPAAPSVSAQDEVVLNFLEESLPLKPDANNKFIGLVTVQNTSADEVSGFSFKATLRDSDNAPFNDGQPVDMVVRESSHCPDNVCSLPSSEVGQFVLELPLGSNDKELGGYIWLDTPAGVKSDVLALTVTPKPAANVWETVLSKVFTPGSTRVPLFAFIVALITTIIALLNIGKIDLRKSVGQVGWDFSKNWLSSVTGVTALAGSITGLFALDGGQILTENEKFSEYAFLFALFGLMVIVAPLIGQMLSVLRPAGKFHDETPAWVYVLAVAVVIWSAIGVLLTTILFIAEGFFAGNISDPAAIAIIFAASILVLLTCFYSGKKTIIFARQTTRLVERQDAVSTLLNNVKHVLAVPVDDIEEELNEDVRRPILEGIVGFGPPGESIQSALGEAIERLETSPDKEPILNALKIGLEAVLALLKPGEDGSYQPTASEQEAVTNLYKAVSSDPPDGVQSEQLRPPLMFAPARTVVLITPPSGSVRPKVYLP